VTGTPSELRDVPGALAALLVVAWLAGACALPGFGPAAGEKGRGGPVARPSADPEYDVLVGEFAARDRDLETARAAFLRAAEKDPDSAYLQRRVALHSAQLGDTEMALAHAQRAVELDPSDIDARLLLARLRAGLGDVDGVLAALTDERGQPVSERAGLVLVNFLIEHERAQEAVALGRRLRESYPDDPQSYLLLLAALESAGQRAEMEATLLDAIRRFPDRADLYVRLARLRRAAGDSAGEIAAYRMLLERQPEHYGTLMALGDALIRQSEFSGALDIYLQLESDFPDEPNIKRRLAWLEWQIGRPEHSEQRLVAELANHPDDASSAYMLGLVRMALGDEARAIEAFERIPSEHTSYVEARLQIASILEAQQRWDEALSVLEELRTLAPGRELDFHTATVRARAGDVDGAIELVRSHLGENPDDGRAEYQLGLVYEIAEDEDQALAWMQRAIEKDPQNARALNYVGYTWAERGERLDEAESLLERATALEPEDGFIADSLGWVYYRKALAAHERGQRDAARAWSDRALAQIQRAIELSGGDPVISEHLGDVYLLRGDRERALHAYEEAVALVPRPDEQPRLQEKLKALRGEPPG